MLQGLTNPDIPSWDSVLHMRELTKRSFGIFFRVTGPPATVVMFSRNFAVRFSMGSQNQDDRALGKRKVAFLSSRKIYFSVSRLGVVNV